MATGLLEGGLWLCAAGCGLMLLTTRVEVRAAAHAAAQIVPATSAGASGAVMGRLEIDALGLSVPIFRDYDNGSLRRGVGHLPGTALPGGLGNLVLAGHRDTFFRPLRGVRPGMEMRVVDARGSWVYRVDRTEIVKPEEVRVLDIGDRPEMTLITCYPFEYIGAAPKRFIVHTYLLSADSE